MSDAVGSILRDWVSLVLLGLGITFSPHAYFGGLFLAFAGAAISRAWEEDAAKRAGREPVPETRSQFFLVLVTAFFVSTLMSITVHAYFESWSVQVVMAASGFASRKVVTLGLGIMNNIAKRSDTISERIIDRVLPGNDKE